MALFDYSSLMITESEMSDIRHPAVCTSDSEEDLCNFARCYIADQLKRNGHSKLADTLSTFETVGNVFHRLINKIASQLAEERKEQLEEMCFELQISGETLQDTFDAISKEMFRNDIKWGRIVSFIAFSGALAVYCAENSMETFVSKVLKWTESFIEVNLLQWMISEGGWNSFVKHFDDQEKTFPASISNIFMGFGVAALAIGGGFLAFKKRILM